jgi:4-amino-4-deoxy-L-arabinose transferase-like glycosyltransferase
LLPTNFFSRRIFFPWLVLAGICAAHVAIVWYLHPTNFFGMSADDAIYFSSAKSLAQGNGYVLPNLAGSPPATKYPILYPWLLSWIWRVFPSFPANLSAAAAFNLAFGVVYLLMMFLFLLTLKGITDRAALIVTAFCAFHPYILGLSANLLVDIPFAALVVASFVLAARSLEKNAGLQAAAGCGIVSGLSVLLKVLGLPAAAGLFLALAIRGGWRKSMAFAAGVLPFVLTLLWRSILAAPSEAPTVATSCSRSWQLSWVYYMNYQTFWKSSAIENHMLWNYLKTNINFFVYQLGEYFIDLRQVRVTPLTIIVFALVCLAVVRGLVRQIQLGGWHPVHFALAIYLIPVLIWDFPSPERFLVPFLMLFAAAIWLEASHLTEQMRISFRKSRSLKAWIAALLCLSAIAVVLYVAGISWQQGFCAIADLSRYRATLLPDKREAYQWLRENTPPDARVIAYEEATMFLYTDRQGMSPTILSPAGKIDTQLLDSQLSCLLATAEPIGASYWLVSEDDFKLEWETATIQERSRASELEKSYQQLFRSSQNRVRIYRLTAQ